MKQWYVFKVGGGVPRVKHPSYQSALMEAQRMQGCLGGEFEVLAIEACVKPAPRYVVEDYRGANDGIPF
jgi:limonene-1,2-epoxide hydrolase